MPAVKPRLQVLAVKVARRPVLTTERKIRQSREDLELSSGDSTKRGPDQKERGTVLYWSGHTFCQGSGLSHWELRCQDAEQDVAQTCKVARQHAGTGSIRPTIYPRHSHANKHDLCQEPRRKAARWSDQCPKGVRKHVGECGEVMEAPERVPPQGVDIWGSYSGA